jgi:hypothetical protein
LVRASLPGQTLDQRIVWWTNDGIVGYALAVTVCFAMALVEWVGYLRNAPRQPILFSVCTVAAIVALRARMVYVRKQGRPQDAADPTAPAAANTQRASRAYKGK